MFENGRSIVPLIPKLVNKKYDIHIMSTDLDNQINKAIKLNPEYISFHYESTKEIDKYILSKV